jgi:hypothetical protein
VLSCGGCLLDQVAVTLVGRGDEHSLYLGIGEEDIE